MEVRLLEHDGALIVQLRGVLDVGELYQLVKLARERDFQRYTQGRIYDLRSVTNQVTSISAQIQAVEDWLKQAPHPRQPVVFVSSASWAMAANRIVRSLLDLDNWHLTSDFGAALRMLGIETGEAEVLHALESQAPIPLDSGPEDDALANE